MCVAKAVRINVRLLRFPKDVMNADHVCNAYLVDYKQIK